MDKKARLIALYLPQFHPIPENDKWWGKGFTEWTNVVKGKPRFKGHYQPHLPKDLGYYDLRLPETREAQAELAKKYGIYGFCYYHYWFNGRRILEAPVDAILSSGKPDFPFMLCWANENWTRNWDGGFDQVLLKQNYPMEDIRNHVKYLARCFQDDRYIKVDGKPVFAIYKDEDICELERYIQVFREELYKYKIEMYLCRFERRKGTITNFKRAFSIFDAGIEFQPLTRQFMRIAQSKRKIAMGRFMKPVYDFCSFFEINPRIYRKMPIVLSYRDVIENDLNEDFQQGWPIYPGVCPGWDNSARRLYNRAMILDGSTPELFGEWVIRKIEGTNWDILHDNFIFINAWNEWAEGNHLEPCERWGCQYLETLQRSIDRQN